MAAKRKFSSIAKYLVPAVFRAAICNKEKMGFENVSIGKEVLSVVLITVLLKVLASLGHSCKRE